LVKERFDAAVAGVSPDVVSLVGGGLTAGRGIRRRRRLQGAVAVLATAAVAAGALSASGTIGNLLNSQGSDSTGRPGKLVEFEPATPRGLAAAVMAHTSGLGTLIGVGGTTPGQHSSNAQSRRNVQAELGYRTDSGIKVDLHVLASPQISVWRRSIDCAGQPSGTCISARLPDGTTRVVLQEAAGGKPPSAPGVFSGPHLIVVGILRPDSFVVVIETVVNSAQSPLGVAALQKIATDPAVGLSTTGALNAQGLRIPHFQRSLVTSSGSSSGSATASPPNAAKASSSASTQGTPQVSGSPQGSGSAPPPNGVTASSPASSSASTAPPG
jgi:hypothetical protein